VSRNPRQLIKKRQKVESANFHTSLHFKNVKNNIINIFVIWTSMKGRNMNLTIKNLYWRIINVTFFAGVFVFLLYQGYLLAFSSSTDTWLTGDWLINYQGGMVRRGLLGEIFLKTSQFSGINIVAIVVVFQILLYLIFLINACRLSMNSKISVLNAAIIFSPAFILFPVLDPTGGFRKEILLFALLSTLCSYLIASNNKNSRLLPVCIGIATAIIAFSHEMLVIYLPYVICAFIIQDKGLSHRVKIIILSIIPALVISIFLMTIFTGDRHVVIEICTSLKTSAPQYCNLQGAIAALGLNIKTAHTVVIEYAKAETLLVYGLTMLLSFAPLVFMLLLNQFSKYLTDLKIRFWLSLCVVSSIICNIPFLFVAVDIGRFIYIHITCLSLLALMMTRDRENVQLHLNLKQIAAWVVCILFASSWRLIHYAATFDSAFPLKAIIERLF
jgi:hypothetical protein